jgi:hypothetical protein
VVDCLAKTVVTENLYDSAIGNPSSLALLDHAFKLASK